MPYPILPAALRRRLRILLSVLALTLHSTPGHAQEAPPFQWAGVLQQSRVVQVKSVYGGIHVHRSTGDSVRVVATKRAGQQGVPEDVRIEVVTHEEGVTVCSIYPPAPLGVDPMVAVGPNRCVPGRGEIRRVQGNDTRVDVVVYLPDGVDFDGSVVEGDIRVDSVRAAVWVSSVSGDVTLVDLDAEAALGSSTSGQVLFRGVIRPRGWYRFASTSGAVDVAVPLPLDALVTLRTVNGEIHSDFDLPAEAATERTGPLQKRVLTLMLGGGAARLDLETTSGSIHLREQATQ